VTTTFFKPPIIFFSLCAGDAGEVAEGERDFEVADPETPSLFVSGDPSLALAPKFARLFASAAWCTVGIVKP
jgi:hypothetical protein